jgi:DNA-directed RNA polymerase specialized sigma subunit
MRELNLIHKIAWSFHKTTGIELNELFSEACLAYCLALKNYNPKKAKITTYMWNCIYNHMKTYLVKYHQKQPKLLSFEDLKFDKEISFQNIFERLSPEAQEIAKIILSSPKKYAIMEKNDVVQKVIRIMKRNGWGWRKIAIGLHDLNNVFNN